MSKQRGLYFDDETTRVLVQKLDGRIKEIFGHIYRESAALPSFKIKQGEVAGGEGVDLDDSGWEEWERIWPTSGFGRGSRYRRSSRESGCACICI